MPTKTPQTANVTRGAPHHRTVAYDEQDIFFRNTLSRQSGLVVREGQSVTYYRKRA
ncbi:hypothetical protein [Pseudomonas sp. 2822-15]|uniref:hypothetical protein n=1 Tax=Pseudomonas sp. 2822-15 TaxID=1712677 RepID=UPI0015AAFC36|nr:hypothetical protein [Pseudomonas sp. 2822-15]